LPPPDRRPTTVRLISANPKQDTYHRGHGFCPRILAGAPFSKLDRLKSARCSFGAASATPPYKAFVSKRPACAQPWWNFVFWGGTGEMVPLHLAPLLDFLEPCWLRDLGGYSVIYRVAQPSHQGARCCHGLFCASASFVAAVDIFILHIGLHCVMYVRTHTTRTGLCVTAPCLSLTMAGPAVSDCMSLPPSLLGSGRHPRCAVECPGHRSIGLSSWSITG
jgi:hypothetical protein